MSGIDYAKWDKLDCYEDSSSSDDGEARMTQPRVTKLHQPCKVTRTADGEIIIQDAVVVDDRGGGGGSGRDGHAEIGGGAQISQPENATGGVGVSGTIATATKKTSIKVEADNTSGVVPESSVVPSAGIDSLIPSLWIEKGGSYDASIMGTQIHWSQDRYSVTLRMLLPRSSPARGWSCQVSNLLPYDRRYSAVGTSEPPRLRVFRTNDQKHEHFKDIAELPHQPFSLLLLEGDLPHPVHANEDEDGVVDWTIESLRNDKYVTVTLNKATPMQGLTLWWKRPLVDCPEIQIDWNRNASSEAFAKAWNEAHVMFQEKRAKGGL